MHTGSDQVSPLAAALARLPRVVYLLAGLAAGAGAALVAWMVPRPGDVPVVRYQRVSCGQARSLLDEARASGQAGPAVVIIANRHAMWADRDQRPGVGQSYNFGCEGVDFVAAGAIFPGSSRVDSHGRSAFLVRPHPDGRLEMARMCLGCEDVGEGAAVASAERMRTMGCVLGGLSLALLVGYRLRRPVRLGDALLRAPTGCEDRPTPPPVRARLEALRGGETIELDGPRWAFGSAGPRRARGEEDPHLVLPAAEGPFRERPAAPPLLVGPARVNGLALPGGQSTPLQDDDVIAAGGGPRYRLRLDDGTPLLRYHFAGSGRLRLLTLSPRAAVGRTIAAASAGVCSAVGIALLLDGLLEGLLPAVACLALAAAAVAFAPSRPGLHPVEVEVPAEPPLVLPELGPGEVANVRIEDQAHGGFELIFDSGGGEPLYSEHVPGWRRPTAEAKALAAALRQEAGVLAERLAPLVVPTEQ